MSELVLPSFSIINRSSNGGQNGEDNVEEAVTGVKGELAVKLFGTDLDELTKKAAEIQSVMSNVPGVVERDNYLTLTAVQ